MSFSLTSSQCYTPEDAVERVCMYERRMCPTHIQTFPLYLEALQSSGRAQCSTVWVKGTVAYRCRTCQVSDNSAICQECFLKGGHKQHDYVMFHSDSGGCCDCGVPECWQEIGFCSAHRSVDRQDHSVPAELEGPTKNSVSDVLGMLSFIISCIPETNGGPPVSRKKRIETAMVYLEWLQMLCSVDALRKIVCSEIVQRTVTDRETRELKAPLQILLKMFFSMPEEIIEGETTLFLQMRYDPVFKQQYAEEFMDNYQTVIESVVDRSIRDSLNDPLIHYFKILNRDLDPVMVYLSNVKNMELIRSKNLLRSFVMSIGEFLRGRVRSGTIVLNSRDPYFAYVYEVHIGIDLRRIVAHPDVAQLLVEEQPDVFMSILDILAHLQWIYPSWLGICWYMDFEVQNEWISAMVYERNTMDILVQIISGCHEVYKPELEGSIEICRKTLLTTASLTLIQLHSYLNKDFVLDFLNDTSSNSPMTPHIPLHRTLSATLAKLVLLPWKDAKNGFLSSMNSGFTEKEVLALMEHPLRIMVWMAQNRPHGWKHASLVFLTYEQICGDGFWRNRSKDMDILLLQFCAVARENMERAVFMRVAERFKVKEMVSSPQFKNFVSYKMALLHDFIRLVLLVVRERRNIGMEEDDCLRYDVIQWLCVKNQTYSWLYNTFCATPMDKRKLTAVLKKVAHFHHPKVQKEGYYELKAECWQEFNPLFAHFNTYESEKAQERAVHVGNLSHYWRIKPLGVVKQPYDRLINLLHTEECHQLLWNVLNYVSVSATKNTIIPACEALGVLALQMMGLALEDRRDNPDKLPESSAAGELSNVWSNDIFVNVDRRPQFNESTRLMEWGFLENGTPSLVDLLCKLRDVRNAPRLVDSVKYVIHLLGYVVRFEASPTNIQPRFVYTQDPKGPSMNKVQVVSTEKEDYELLKKMQQCSVIDFASCLPLSFDQDENGHPPTTLVPQRKHKGEVVKVVAETLVPKVEDKRVSYEKLGAKDHVAIKERLELIDMPTLAYVAAESSNTLSKVTHKAPRLRRARTCGHEAAATRDARKTIDVEECGEASNGYQSDDYRYPGEGEQATVSAWSDPNQGKYNYGGYVKAGYGGVNAKPEESVQYVAQDYSQQWAEYYAQQAADRESNGSPPTAGPGAIQVVAPSYASVVSAPTSQQHYTSPILPASSAVEADGGIAKRVELTVLEPKHKVFLSHSGAQKNFVEQLCVDLERCDQYPFFDKRLSSLPIGKNFPKLIFEAIEQCEVGVVVFSEEFFTRSKWPMLELVAMTKNPNLVIIPVFLDISLQEVHDLKKREMWLLLWREWAKEDERLDVEEWIEALKSLRSKNSLLCNEDGEVGFRGKIVEAVCKILLPEIRWRDSHIQGRSRLCKVLHDKIGQARLTNEYGPCLVGLYGVGGIGKTTICQALCNDYFTKMHGKVCHLELGNASNLELLHEALKRLSDKSHEVWSKWNESQCEDLLKREMQKYTVFLAIDNLCDSQKSLKQANLFLRGCFGHGSIVIMTSRSLKVLKMHHLDIDDNNCLEMPELEFDDAKSLFLQHAKCDKKTMRKVGDFVQSFVKRCYFKKSNGESYHYHPLALEVLGMHLGGTKCDAENWEAELKVLDALNPRRELEHPIFSILRKSFDTLLLEDKMIFIDIALYMPENSMGYKCNVLEWLSMVHGRHVQEVIEVLKGLERKALIQDLGDGVFTKVGMHDLWHEFAALETKVGEFASRRWIYEVNVSSALEASTPIGGFWQNVKRMYFSESGLSHLKSIKLNHFSNIVVMKLIAPKVNQQLSLMLEVDKLIHLKSLELEMGYGEGIQVVGLRLLENLLFLKLKDGGFSIDDVINDIEHLTNLQGLVLTYFQSEKLPNLSNLISLEEVNFFGCRNVVTICGLSSRLSRLRVLILDGCEKLRSLGPSAGGLHTLQKLSLQNCVNLKEGQVIGKRKSEVFTDNHKYIGVRRWIEKVVAETQPRQMGEKSCKVWLSVYGTEKEAALAFAVGKNYYGVQKHRFNFEAFPRLLGPPINLQTLSPKEQNGTIIRLARDYANNCAYTRF